jgi:Mrp family chromosome partitioning ATPase
MDTRCSLGLFRQAGVPVLGVVENMSYLNCRHCDEPVDVFYRLRRLLPMRRRRWLFGR